MIKAVGCWKAGSFTTTLFHARDAYNDPLVSALSGLVKNWFETSCSGPAIFREKVEKHWGPRSQKV